MAEFEVKIETAQKVSKHCYFLHLNPTVDFESEFPVPIKKI